MFRWLSTAQGFNYNALFFYLVLLENIPPYVHIIFPL